MYKKKLVLPFFVLFSACMGGQSQQLCSVQDDSAYMPETAENKCSLFESSRKIHSEPEVRPFITDDARVVGNRLAQMEAWLRFDRETGQQWVIFAYGPTQKLELSCGAVLGYEKTENSKISFSYALPLLQVKYLFQEYRHRKPPGIGIVVGTFLPAGRGSFKPGGYGTFGYLTATQCIGSQENYLIHVNVGANYLHIDGTDQLINTWGVGTQIKTYKGFHLVGELISGDPYVPGTGMAYQIGFRQFVNNLFQFDMTLGKGIAGRNLLPLWISGGVRIVTERYLLKKRKNYKKG